MTDFPFRAGQGSDEILPGQSSYASPGHATAQLFQPAQRSIVNVHCKCHLFFFSHQL